jgi:hypothetical protein
MGVVALPTDIKGPSGLTSKHEYCFRARTNKILNSDVRFVLEVLIFFGAQAEDLAGSEAAVPARKRTPGRGAFSLLRQQAALQCFFHAVGRD